jgi:hypothetical protein
VFRALYESLVGGLATLLENSPREEVVTRTDVSGAVENPQVSTWQTVFNLIKNAFFKSILPGFDKEITSHRSSWAQLSTKKSLWTVYFFCPRAVARGTTCL